MKRVMVLSAIALLFAAVPSATSQNNTPPAQKLSIPLTGAGGPATGSALSIEREVSYPSVIRLKGDVEIKWKGMILNTQEASYDEKTGQIEARGTVRVKPYPWTEAEKQTQTRQ